MEAAHQIFGKHTFRKFYSENSPRSPINKALFEGWSLSLDRLSDDALRTLTSRRRAVIRGAIELMRQSDFQDAISLGTGDLARVRLRDELIWNLITRVLHDHRNRAAQL
jgi:hypothetical protein